MQFLFQVPKVYSNQHYYFFVHREFFWDGNKINFSVCILSSFSCAQLFATLWIVAYQAHLSIGSPGKSTGVDCYALLQGIFPTQGSNLSLMSPALADGFFTMSATWEAPINFRCQVNSRFKKNYSLGI